MFKLKLTVAALGLSMTMQSQAAILELALVLDGSGSISSSEYNLQLQGYRDIIASGSFFDDFISSSIYDEVHLAAWQFATGVTSEIGWTNITSNSIANTFGNQFNVIDMPQLGGFTNTSAAINAASTSMLGNGVGGEIDDNMIIDISTDGRPNRGGGESGAVSAADTSRSLGITTNTIGVGNNIGTDFLTDLVGLNNLDLYTNDSPTGFYLTASTFNEFGSTLNDKLTQEIIGQVPEPENLGMLLIGLSGIYILRSRKQKVSSEKRTSV